MKYGSVVFDMDGVVLDFRGDGFNWKYDAVRAVLEKKGVDTSGLERSDLDAFLGDQGLDACVEACETRGLEPAEVWNEIAEATTRARAEQMKNGGFRIHPDAEDAIKELRDREVELGLISNAPEAAVEATVNYYGLKGYFKFFRGIEDFEDLPMRKPRPDHLEFAEAELKRPPYLYAGDAESDIIAARRAGMDSAWVKRNGGSLDVKPDYTIQDLNQLVEIVAQK